MNKTQVTKVSDLYIATHQQKFFFTKSKKVKLSTCSLSAIQMLQSTVLGKIEDDEGEGGGATRSGRKKEEKNILAQITVKNHWALLK